MFLLKQQGIADFTDVGHKIAIQKFGVSKKNFFWKQEFNTFINEGFIYEKFGSKFLPRSKKIKK